MAISILLLAAITYGLCFPDVCSIVSRVILHDDLRQYGPSDYPHMLKRFGWRGLSYALIGDVIRALLAVLFGALLLAGKGFPVIGKLLALFFTLFYLLLGHSLPNAPLMHRKRDMIYPALLLLFVDWKLFLICVALAVLALALTGSRGLMALTAAVALPLFSLLFGNWWLRVFLALLCALCFAALYYEEIRNFFTRRKRPAARRSAPQEEQSEDPGNPGT